MENHMHEDCTDDNHMHDGVHSDQTHKDEAHHVTKKASPKSKAKATTPKKDKGVDAAAKHLSDMADEAVEKGYAEDALSDHQKAALEHEASFADDSEAFEADEDGDNYIDRRNQV